MSDFNDGQIHGWNGGECPVHHKSEVVVWFRNQAHQYPTFAEYFWWKHSDSDGDIIAFQVTKPFIEPKVIWVNKTSSGQMIAYDSESEARNKAISTYASVAVKYVEAKE
jgi:hypothetical protein